MKHTRKTIPQIKLKKKKVEENLVNFSTPYKNTFDKNGNPWQNQESLSRRKEKNTKVSGELSVKRETKPKQNCKKF